MTPSMSFSKSSYRDVRIADGQAIVIGDALDISISDRTKGRGLRSLVADGANLLHAGLAKSRRGS